MAILAHLVVVAGCEDPAPTGPEGQWDVEILVATIDVLEDCEGPPEDSPGEWAWRLTLEVQGRDPVAIGTSAYPAFEEHVDWSDGETYPVGQVLTSQSIPGSRVPSVVLTLSATEWDVGTDPPTPDALMDNRMVRHEVPFVEGVVEDSFDLSDESNKCWVRVNYSASWQEA